MSSYLGWRIVGKMVWQIALTYIDAPLRIETICVSGKSTSISKVWRS